VCEVLTMEGLFEAGLLLFSFPKGEAMYGNGRMWNGTRPPSAQQGRTIYSKHKWTSTEGRGIASPT
jgi:hypothetical protein